MTTALISRWAAQGALPAGFLVPLAIGLAAVVWPDPARGCARRRLARLAQAQRSRGSAGLPELSGPAGSAESRAERARPLSRREGSTAVTLARFVRFGRDSTRVARPARLGADVLMELVACGLRAGLSVADALACSAAVAGEPGADPGGHGPLAPHSARLGGWRRRRLVEAPADPAYLDQVVSRLRLGASAAEAWARPPPDLVSLARALQLAELSGAPAAAVVSRAATDLRARLRERTELAAARLGVRLVLPLGLAVLPGFVLLAVAPIVLGLATSVLHSAG